MTSRRKDRALNDPCIAESEASLKCQINNGRDRDACEEFIQHYQMCKTFWGKVTSKRFYEGLTPNLPPPEDRLAYLKKYQATGKIPTTID